MPKRVGNLYEKFIAYDNWQKAKIKAFKGKRTTLAVKRYESYGEDYTEKLRNDFINEKFILAGYTKKKVYEPKERTIYIARLEERVFHWATVLIIEPIFEPTFNYHSYSCRKNKGQHKASLANAEAVRKYKYVIDVDASKFYPSINHDLLKKDLEHKIKDKEFLEKTIFKIIDSHHTEGKYGYGIPIGNYSSQILGNIYMTKFDNFCCRLDGAKRMLRYCDNSLIFFNDRDKARKAKRDIEIFYNEVLNMKMSKCELYPTSQGVDFVGYRSFKKVVLLRKRTAKRMKKRIRMLPYLLANHKITLKQAMGQLASAKGWAQHARTKHFCEQINLDKLLEEIKSELRQSS